MAQQWNICIYIQGGVHKFTKMGATTPVLIQIFKLGSFHEKMGVPLFQETNHYHQLLNIINQLFTIINQLFTIINQLFTIITNYSPLSPIIHHYQPIIHHQQLYITHSPSSFPYFFLENIDFPQISHRLSHLFPQIRHFTLLLFRVRHRVHPGWHLPETGVVFHPMGAMEHH